MTKLNISMPEELLARIDAEAGLLGISRSGLIQEASTLYIARSQTDREVEKRRLRAEDAGKRMKRIGAKMGLSAADDPVALLAEARAAEESRHGQ
ncbi:MAG: ribbon-helix-helix protein, CopG family [Coriobacteriia bacterium]